MCDTPINGEDCFFVHGHNFEDFCNECYQRLCELVDAEEP